MVARQTAARSGEALTRLALPSRRRATMGAGKSRLAHASAMVALRSTSAGRGVRRRGRAPSSAYTVVPRAASDVGDPPRMRGAGSSARAFLVMVDGRGILGE
jgi:hypothetical protein